MTLNSHAQTSLTTLRLIQLTLSAAQSSLARAFSTLASPTLAFSTLASPIRVSLMLTCSLMISWVISAPLAWANDPQANLKHESLGSIQLDMPMRKVLKLIGRPQETSPSLRDDDSGCMKRVHFYRSGLEVETCERDESETVYSLRVVKERGVKTSRGVEVGAHADQITQTYTQYARRGSHAIVISDPRLHLKLRFLLERGEVYEISLYHAPDQPKSKRPTIKRRRRRVLFGQ